MNKYTKEKILEIQQELGCSLAEAIEVVKVESIQELTSVIESVKTWGIITR